MESQRRTWSVRVVCGAGPEYGPERGAHIDVRGRDCGAPAQGPPVIRIHVHHHAGIVRSVPDVYRFTMEDHCPDQHIRSHRVVRGRRAPSEYGLPTRFVVANRFCDSRMFLLFLI